MNDNFVGFGKLTQNYYRDRLGKLVEGSAKVPPPLKQLVKLIDNGINFNVQSIPGSLDKYMLTHESMNKFSRVGFWSMNVERHYVELDSKFGVNTTAVKAGKDDTFSLF